MCIYINICTYYFVLPFSSQNKDNDDHINTCGDNDIESLKYIYTLVIIYTLFIYIYNYAFLISESMAQPSLQQTNWYHVTSS